jgi:Mrp family chromosome partitioning ATPase
LSSYYQTLRKTKGKSPTLTESMDIQSRSMDTKSSGKTALVQLPVAHPAPAMLARSAPLQRVCELFTPLAVVNNDLRMLFTGCRPGDGASTIAAAFALDLSQRLSLRTLLIDANSRRPTLHRSFVRSSVQPPELVLDGPMQIRSTGWAWLDLATCCLGSTESERRDALVRCDEVSRHYAAVVVDLGVVRLDARMLPLARETDPIFLIARYGHTRREELATTSAALRAAKRSPAGAILNAAMINVARQLRKGS